MSTNVDPGPAEQRVAEILGSRLAPSLYHLEGDFMIGNLQRLHTAIVYLAAELDKANAAQSG